MLRLIIALLAAMLFTPAVTWADTTGALNGTISDSASGSPLGNVAVTAISPQQHEEAKTDQHGSYAFLDLQPGVYMVSAIRAGYEPYSARVAVRSGSETTLRIALVEMLRTVIVDCFCPKLLMQPGVVADEYRIRRWNSPPYEFMDSAFQMLFIVPGITFGSAARMMR